MTTKNFEDLLTEDGALSEIKDEAQKKVLLNVAKALGQRVDEMVEERVQDSLAARGYAPQREREIDRKYRTMLDAWRNNGRVASAPGTRISLSDMIEADKARLRAKNEGKLKAEDYIAHDANDTFWGSPMLLPRVISTLIREPAEVVQRLTPLLTKVRMPENVPPGQGLVFPAISSYMAGNLDMGDLDRYPEGMLEFGGTVVATIGKCGIKIRATQSMLDWSYFDVWNMHLRAAGTALGRWKEQKVANQITAQGSTQKDNSSGTPADWTQGRDSAFLYNGTFAVQDLHDGFAAMLNDGLTPNTLLMNPMAWTIFAQDPLMRNWAYAQAAGGGIWEKVRGEVASIRQWMQGMNGSNKVDDPQQIATTYTDVPQLFPYPLQIILSPFIPYDPSNNTTTIILCDSSELGIMTVVQDIRTKEWDEPERDIRQLAMDEKYAINILNEGRGVRQFKNVILARSYDIDDKVQLQVTGPIPTARSFSL